MRRIIKAGGTDFMACRAAGISARKLYAARMQELADLPRHKRGPKVGSSRSYLEWEDLPQEEIYKRAALLREGWSEEEKMRRYNPRFSAMLE